MLGRSTDLSRSGISGTKQLRVVTRVSRLHTIKFHFLSDIPLATNSMGFTGKGDQTVSDNDYNAAEVVVIGTAQEVIRGSIKGIFFDDCPGQERRTIVIDFE